MNKVFKAIVLMFVLSLSLSLISCGENQPAPTDNKPIVKEEPKEDTTIKVGSFVAAKWADGKYWGATVTSVDTTGYTVKYEDGMTGQVPKAETSYISMKPVLKIGDTVWAIYQTGGKFYSGVVSEIKTDGAMIKWDDGTTPSFVLFGKITKEALKEDKTETISTTSSTGTDLTTNSGVTFKVGDSVAGEWQTDSWWMATIKSINGDKYDVEYSDKTTGTLTKSQLKLLDKTFKPKVGDSIMANWNGMFYLGTVTELKTDGAMMKWDDGSTPSLAQFGEMYTK